MSAFVRSSATESAKPFRSAWSALLEAVSARHAASAPSSEVSAISDAAITRNSIEGALPPRRKRLTYLNSLPDPFAIVARLPCPRAEESPAAVRRGRRRRRLRRRGRRRRATGRAARPRGRREAAGAADAEGGARRLTAR